MARQTVVEFFDDIDNSPAIGTTKFMVDGTFYEIDLSQKHRDEFNEALKKFIAHAIVNRDTTAVSKSNVTPIRRQYGTGPVRKDTKNIREWLRANGRDISDRGRIPIADMQAFEEAHDANGNEIRSAARPTLVEARQAPAATQEQIQMPETVAEPAKATATPEKKPAAKKTAAKSKAA